MEKISLLSFADYMIYRTNRLERANAVISGMERLKQFGLEINKEKSQIMEGPTQLKGLSEFGGIPITKKVKLLGYKLCSRKTELIREAKEILIGTQNKYKGK